MSIIACKWDALQFRRENDIIPCGTFRKDLRAMDLLIRPLSMEEAKTIYFCDLQRDFPADEIKPWAAIRRSMKRGAYRCLGLYREDHLLGYAFFLLHQSSALLDYFAILPDFRGQGLGSRFLAKMPEYLDGNPCILAEAEAPDAAADETEKEIRSKRLQFYLKNGLRDTGLRPLVFGVRFAVLWFPNTSVPPQEEAQTVYSSLYRSFLPQSVFQNQLSFGIQTTDGGKKQPSVNEPPRRGVLEEVGNAVTHGVGALLGIAGLVLLLLRSDTGAKVLSSCIYGFCMIVMFLMSCLYHSFKGGSKVKRVWRRFDYISIYLLIGGSFTPLWLVYWGNVWGIVLCCVQWAILITGIVFISVFGPGRLRWIHMTLYIAVGWSALVFLPGMLKNDLPLFLYILGGGVIYTLGIIPFALKRKGAHFLWHFFVLFGALVQFLGIYLYVY